MPFNPTLPAHNSPILSGELRNQFNGLKDLIDDNIPATEKGAPDGVASLDANGVLAQAAQWASLSGKPAPVPDGTYTMGFGTVQNGTITVVNGIITGIQEASNGDPNAAVFVGSGFEDTPCNGNWFLLGNNGKNTYRNEASNRVCSADIQTGRWYIGAAEWPNQGNQSYVLTTTDDPPIGPNWSSAFWLMPGTTSAA